MKKIALFLVAVSCTFLRAQNIAFDKLYGNSDPVNYFLGNYPVAGSVGLNIQWHGGIRLSTAFGIAVQVLENTNVGIGNTDPAEKLDVSGNLLLRNNSNTVGGGNVINFSSFGKDYGSRIRSSLQFASGNDSKQALILSSYWEGYKDELTLIGGKVGIGTSVPQSKLEIAENIGAVLSLTTNKLNGTAAAPLKPAIEFLGFDNGKKARISAVDQSYDTHGSKLTFAVNDGGSASSLVERMSIVQSGNVGIGVSNPQNRLDVNGVVHAKEVKVDLTGWADFVFEKDYDLPTLEEVERHISDKGHLPNIPSEKEVLMNGLSLGQNQKMLLQKIEELTLYSIEQSKQLKEQAQRIKTLEELAGARR